jgi:uncharacterized protein YbjT (DUF2867 family)
MSAAKMELIRRIFSRDRRFDLEDARARAVLWRTFLRPSGFASNTRIWAPQIRASNMVGWPYGAAKRSLIHERDITAVDAHTLTEGYHIGARYLLTGPQAVSHVEQLQIIAEVIGRELTYEEVAALAAPASTLCMGCPRTSGWLLPRRARVR